MTMTISVRGKDVRFDCAEGETVLDAAERAGYSIPYSCRKGVCSTCEGGITSGTARVRGQGVCTGPAQGVRLCQARPETDLEIDPVRLRKIAPVARKVLQAKVRTINRPAADVAVIRLRFPNGVRADFKAGQYLRVQMPDGDSRNYSMANPPQQNDGLELHIRHVPGGKFSETILAGLGKGSVLTVELPYGEFTVDDASQAPAILLATGTGFAPLRAIVEDHIRRGAPRPMHLYWGANTAADLYELAQAESWAAAHDWFDFTPVVSRPDSGWTGRTGFVHCAVLEDFPDLSGHEVYACGAPVMIDAAIADFGREGGLGSERFHSDAFVATGDLELETSA